MQSLKDKKKKRSRKWNVLNKKYKIVKRKLRNKNKDFQHKMSKTLVDYCKKNQITKVIYGDIKTKSCVGRVKKLNKSTQSQGYLSRFKFFVKYKTFNENIELVKQNEAWTSRTNCLTGKRFDKKLKLSNRIVRLNNSLKMSRDGNGAINIMLNYLNGKKPIKGEWLTHLKSLNFSMMLLDYNSNLIVN